MGKVAKLEVEVKSLSPEELSEFRKWFSDFEWAAWDAQLERDVRAGRLDALAEEALADHSARKTTRL